ncbi:hypothetical protein GCM10009624_01190 [Gordonia sinesedis]
MPSSSARTRPGVRQYVLTGLLVLLAAWTAMACTTASPADESRQTGTSTSVRCMTDVGVATGTELLDLSQAQLNRELDAMRAMGAKWIRVGIEWDAIEPERGQFDWRSPDRVINTAVGRGFRVLALVHNTPRWARPNAAMPSMHTLPRNADEYATFAGEAAARYGDRVQNWEVWNEPNIIEFAKPRPDVRRYHDMLVAASRTIRERAGREVTIVSGGLAPAPESATRIAPDTFVRQLYALGATDSWDAVAIHPYTYPALPNDQSTSSWNTFLRLPQIRRIIDAAGGERTPIWITEFGAPTGGSRDRAVTPDQQAQAISTVLTSVGADPRYGPTFIYAPRDRGTDPNEIEDHFGLLYRDFTPKPAYRTIQDLTCRRR